ncbi:MAG: hypothetical protein J0M35_07215 [Candidatus Obscuribacter phosphatis]|uniref:Uncharacterized protein n=1 Tax=Candidatus Obscuribacter phosphatis TaxID=1906157 RepID=A0A8J7P818_9BACT|nr:hypothetical protein [Candidatus Obscuribacter phosphatis]
MGYIFAPDAAIACGAHSGDNLTDAAYHAAFNISTNLVIKQFCYTKVTVTNISQQY